LRVSVNPTYSYASWKSLQSGYQPRLTFGRAWTEPLSRTKSESLVDQLVEVRGASPQFVSQVKTLLAKFPPSAHRALLNAGHQLWITDRLRRDRPELLEDNDYTGGRSEHGPTLKRITIAETLFSEQKACWEGNHHWENSVIHEIGHVLSWIAGEKAARKLARRQILGLIPRCWSVFAGKEALRKLIVHLQGIPAQYWRLMNNGYTEHPDFKAAWQKDYQNLPKEQRFEKLDKTNFAYFVAPDMLPLNDSSDFVRARKETFAEGVDVLLRGKASTINYADFHRYFPETLKVIARVLRENYGITEMPINGGQSEK
jgi:hypothetical protein